MSTVYRFSAEEELATLRQWLWHEHISHYYRQQDGAQLIILINDAQQGPANVLVERWRRNELPPLSSMSSAKGLVDKGQWRSLKQALRHQPVTMALLLACVFIFLLATINGNAVYYALSILSPNAWPSVDDTLHMHAALAAVLQAQEWWRLVTPIFIHFSLAHLVFNMLWLWVFGRHIERDEGSVYWAGLVLLWGILSNLAQLLYAGPAFGGMSGVVYAVMGYLWVEQLTGRRRIPVMPGWLLFMAVLWALWGVVNTMGLSHNVEMVSNMANAAHFGGLFAGCATALMSALWHRFTDRRRAMR